MNDKKIILSGFGTFADYRANTSERTVQALHNQVLSGYRIIGKIFPCSIPQEGENRGEILLELAIKYRAAAIVSLGMASSSSGFQFERRAKNMLHNQKYHPNFENVPVDRKRPITEELALNLTPWNFVMVKKEIELRSIGLVKISSDGGGFCCEHLAYEVLAQQMSQKIKDRLPFAFIHVPCFPKAVERPSAFLRQGKVLVSIDAVIQGLEIILRNTTIP